MKVCHHQPRKFPLLLGLISFILKLSSAFKLMEFYPAFGLLSR
ncbi:MAG: hypothetical protein XD80_0779 [Synergistales bacterium 53_16]|jgi:hypothetical protein|nr:MAG: hypothetical protein XD80_0779 [Synergistales bacterium 53_16]